ncbi:hypothetical protein [Planococcus lenghuensis]|uniref:Uncharacterized protein n=1 Tax=Planococcus lenghuensis TaxID=2213202 RepID=A0A1Q2KWP5_9BACL|nr:hypothetical protein [Planococcus lenghuensis]AQQ52609.1 hypothetical protein B0X71_05525 [Planococcus lenghuensis]
MKKAMLLFISLFFLSVPAVSALEWANFFVVWDGNIYEITEEEIPSSKIGERIGEVTSQANDMTGDFFGNASNYFPTGTDYFTIDGFSANTAIAVETEEGKWIRAVYAHEAPISWLPVRWSTLSGKLLAGIAVCIAGALVYAVAVSKN